jgi:CRISPR-associated Csx2 family protein
MKRQLSFLGKARQDPRTGYRKARYRLDDGREIEGAFFGLSLAREEHPDELCLLGTPGSMWDVMLEEQGEPLATEEQRLALIEAVAASAVTDQLLAPFEAGLSAVTGLRCRLRVTGYARDAREQAGLLHDMSDGLAPGDIITLDVTHGLRHLPMLALAAGHYLERVKGVQVSAIVYGAAELQEGGVVPVVNLGGLLRVLDWVQALSAYDASGNYGVFGPLLEDAGVAGAGARLAGAGFEERITRHNEARNRLNGLDLAAAGDDAFAALFLPELLERTGWWKLDGRWRREAALARQYLDREDYLRATIYAQEALISRGLPDRDAQEFDLREERRIALKDGPTRARILFYLRNELAHGVTSRNPHPDVRSMMRSADSLRAGLRDLLDELLG